MRSKILLILCCFNIVMCSMAMKEKNEQNKPRTLMTSLVNEATSKQFSEAISNVPEEDVQRKKNLFNPRSGNLGRLRPRWIAKKGIR